MLKRTVSYYDFAAPAPSPAPAAPVNEDDDADAVMTDAPSAYGARDRSPTPEDIPAPPSAQDMFTSFQGSSQLAGPSSLRRLLRRSKGGLMEAVLEAGSTASLPSRTQSMPALFNGSNSSKRKMPRRSSTVLAPVAPIHTPRRLRCYTSLLSRGPEESGPRRTRVLSVFAPAPGTKVVRQSGSFLYKRVLKMSFAHKRATYFQMRYRGEHLS